MAESSKHRATVEKVAAEYGATVTFSGGHHLRIEGKGWSVCLPGTPRRTWNEKHVRNRIDHELYLLSLKKASRIGKRK